MGDALVGAGFTVLAALGLAAQSLAVRLGTRTHRVPEVVAIVFVLNLLLLLPVAGIVAYPRYGVTPTAIGAFAVAGLLGSLVARVCYFVGIARLGASRAEPLKALFPVFAVAIAVLVLGERVTPLLGVGVVLLVVGGLGVATETRSSPATATGRRVWLDMGFPLAAALLLGVDPVFTKLGLAEGTPPLVGLAVRILAAAAGFGLYAAWRRVRARPGWSLDPNRWLLAAGVANTVYLLAYHAALARAPVSVVAPLLGVSTLVVVAGAGLFLQRDEQVTWRLAGATLLVVLGAVVVVRA